MGVIFCLSAGVCLSTGGLIVRHIEAADGWQILVYRSFAFSLTLLLFLLVRYRGRVVLPFAAIGWPGAVVAVSLSLGFVFYLFGLLMTTVANTVFIVSAGPFFAALLAWLVVGERVAPRTWLFIAAALAGIGLMFAEGLSTGHWLGDLVALGTPVCFAAMLVAIRKAGDRDMVPASCLAGIGAGLIALVMAPDLAMSGHDLVLSLLLGTVQVGAGFLLITLGARYLPAAEVALLTLSEAVLAPLWVWLTVGETPGGLALLGGAVVIAAVVAQTLSSARRLRRA